MKSLQRIGLLLTLVFLLPALFYSVYELSSLDKDEEMIQEIYAKQLESIIFSANQYADDVVGNWVFKIETGLAKSSPDSISPELKNLLNFNSALIGVFLVDTIEHEPALQKYTIENSVTQEVWERTTQTISNNRELINQFLSLQRSGFQKVERITIAGNEESNIHCLLFTTQISDGFRVAGFFIDAK